MEFRPFTEHLKRMAYASPILFLGSCLLLLVLLLIVVNLIRQQLPARKSEPPLVFHWIPFIGNAVSYGLDPFAFYSQCQKRHGNIFTFVLFGRKMTVYLGLQGNDFILNGKLQDVNAEEIYAPLTTPVFGSDIIYDCPNAKLMEQKKFVKFGLTHDALCSYVPLIEKEVVDYLKVAPAFRGQSGTVNIPAAMAEITIFTASRTLQGKEVREKLSAEFAELYHDLDLGFRPINFLMAWAPLPQNRRRDAAHAKMRSIYIDIINDRRVSGKVPGQDADMIWHLMTCVYKDGTPLPDKEIAHMMITLLMAGQHSSSSSSSWIMLRLASRPDIVEELYQEQVRNLGYTGSEPLQYADIDKLPLLQNVIKETLRVHSSIHSIMRKVMRPIPVPKTDYVIRPDKVLVSSPIMSHMSEEHFANAHVWDPHRWESMSTEEKGDMVDYGYGKVSKGTKSPYLPFGAGRHRCIGEKFAYMNLCTIIATLVRNMKFTPVDGSSAVPPTDYTSLFSRPMQPSTIRWERRENALNQY
ncbi:Eburicol 14-alpha-demethylase [Metarhizium anisopliae BRIP 53293]|uniref:Eburicol 14-alpha-demethylase n=1 Tax=Metarhizium anisopliae BRIP 53293 TaxID=1291518 RepID=A0A0D9NL95_METAN|nr:Eburicol 14-alpha-demethylase [Metarhizium anisopliae BRIP 53293]KJK88407.1 Eburicol 14-alpha-demethylase [Metarhizium anisopliae BRIP 53284]